MTQSKAWMPLYIGDYLADTAHLTAEEHGAYLLLLMHYWRTGPLPADDARLMSICKLSRHKFKKSAPVFLKLFTLKGDKYFHKRMDKELAKATDISEKRAEAAKARWDANGDASAMLLHTQSQSQSPLPLNNKPKEGASAPTFWDVAEGIGIPRSLVGKLIGQHSEGKVADAIAACAIKRPADPKQFLVACLQDRPAKLFVPKEDSELVPFAKANGLPEPGKTETYHEYRQRLWPLVKDLNARMSA